MNEVLGAARAAPPLAEHAAAAHTASAAPEEHVEDVHGGVKAATAATLLDALLPVGVINPLLLRIRKDFVGLGEISVRSGH